MGVGADSIEAMYQKVHAAIRADPAAKPAPKKEVKVKRCVVAVVAIDVVYFIAVCILVFLVSSGLRFECCLFIYIVDPAILLDGTAAS